MVGGPEELLAHPKQCLGLLTLLMGLAGLYTPRPFETPVRQKMLSQPGGGVGSPCADTLPVMLHVRW